MSGVGESQGGSVIPNGQPPQWNHPGKLRPQRNSPITSNGTPTPPTNSYAGSLSSQSSRDPSPIPISSLSQDNIPLVRQSIVNGPSVQRTSHSYSPSEPDGSPSACSQLDSATRHPPTGGSNYRPLDSGSISVETSHISRSSQMASLTFGTSGPSIGAETSNLSGPSNLGPAAGIGVSDSSGPPSAGTSNLSGVSHLEPLTSIAANISEPPTSTGTSNLLETSQIGPPTSVGASDLLGSSQIGASTSTGTSNFSGPVYREPPTSVEAADLSEPLQKGLPNKGATDPSGYPQIRPTASNPYGPQQMGPLTNMAALNLTEPPQMTPPTSTDGLNFSGPSSMRGSNSSPSQMGLPTSKGASNLPESHQMGLPKAMEDSNPSGPSQMGRQTSMGTSKGPCQMGPPTSMGSSNLSAPPQMGPPASTEASNLMGHPQIGLPTGMGVSNLSGPREMGPPTNTGASNVLGPHQMGLPTSIEAYLSGPHQMGSTTNMGVSNLSKPSQMSPPINMRASNLPGPHQMVPPSMGALNVSRSQQMGPLISIGASNPSGFQQMAPPTDYRQMGPPTSLGATNLSEPRQMNPPTSMSAPSLSGPHQMGIPASVGASNLSGPTQMVPPTSMGAPGLSGPHQMGTPTSVGASNLSGSTQMGPPTSMGAPSLSGPHQMGTPTSVGASNLPGPTQMGPPTSMGASSLSSPSQIGVPTSIGASNLTGPHKMGPPTSMGTPNISGPHQMGLPINTGTSNPSGPTQMGLPSSMGVPNLSGPHQVDPLTSMGSSNLPGPHRMGPPTSMGTSNLPGRHQMAPPTSMGATNLPGPHRMGPATSMGASNLLGPHQMGSTTTIGTSDISGPIQMGPPTSIGTSNLSGPHQMGPPTSMGGPNFSGPHQMGPPKSMRASNLSGPHQITLSTSMGGPNLSGPHQINPPTSMAVSGPSGPSASMRASNLSGPQQMGPPTSMGASSLSGPQQMGPPTSMGASSLSGPQQMGPPTSMGASTLSGPQQMGPPSLGASSLSGLHQMGPPTSMGASNLSGPLQMGPPTSMGASNLSGPHQMGPPTSMGSSNLSGPLQMTPPASMGGPNLSGPHQMGPSSSMGGSNRSGPHHMGPPTSMGGPNLPGPRQMGPPTGMGAPNLSGSHQMGPPTSMGAPNLSGPRQMGPPTGMGAPNLSGPHQMGPPTSTGVANISGSQQIGPQMVNRAGALQMGPPTSVGEPSFGPRTVVGSPQMRPPTSIHSSSLTGSPTGPPSGPSSGYVASRQAGIPPTRPTQYPGAPSQSGSIAQDHRQNYQQFGAAETITSQFSNMSVARTGFNKIWGMDSVDLLQYRNVLPAEKVEPPKIRLHQEFLDSVNCSPDIFRCTLTKIPENNSLLQKSRLPLGILIHPFKDLNHLPVVQCSTIVRCRSCRTYINPFVYFVDHKRWKCNLCFRVNELPEEFQYDPVSKTYGDPTRRPEIKSSTIEFIAPSEYMLRPPQPAVYLFLLDVSRLGVESGYLNLFCDTLLEELDKLPGDSRTQIGFITYDSSVHFYNLAEGLNQPQQMIVVDTDEVFLPCPDNLLVNLTESRDLVMDLLKKIPTMFLNSHDTKSSLGPALQAAYKLMAPTGGRVTVFQSCLPNHGPGALVAREDPSQRAGKDAPHLNPVTDFYKRLALDCSGQQIAVDLFIINSQYCDIATISGISRFSGGCIHHFPLFKTSNAVLADSLERCFRRYLTRKIGFEAVMRIRCSRGLGIHTFHGNFFVRSTDLLSLPNVNPDAGFGMQVSVEESLSDIQNICFQAALLYTSSKGERRIRVHTLCLPVAATLSDILYSADQQCIVGLLAKMAVDRSLQSSLSDARDAFINVAIDVLSVYKLVENSGNSAGLLAPMNMRLLPLYILALLKYVAFRTGQSTRLDDRLFAMCQMKTLPLNSLIQAIYPDMYPVHCLDDQKCEQLDIDGTLIPQPPRLHLSAEKLDSRGVFLMDAGDYMMMYVGSGISNEFCSSVLGVPAFSHIPEEMYELPEIESPESVRLRNFVNYLQSEKPYPTMLQVIRDDSNMRGKFIERLIEDRSEAALSYYEFLQHLKANIK